MAASNVIFNLTRSSVPQSPASHNLCPSLKSSTVCFTSASKFSKGWKASEKNRCDDKYWSIQAKPTVEENVDDGKQLFEKLQGAATEYAEETMENVKEATDAISGTAEDYADGAKEKTKEAVETIEAKAEEKSTNKGAVPEPEPQETAESTEENGN